MSKKFYITTPIYYVNDKPHIGHAYTTIAADVLARWHRLQGEEVFFLTGTDEHGDKVAESAKKYGQEVLEFVNTNAKKFRQTFDNLNIQYDIFMRTTKPEHEASVKIFMEKLNKAGALYQGVYQGLYCPSCEDFYTEKDLLDGKCPVHLIALKMLEEKNWFFKLKKYLPAVKKVIENGKLEIAPETIKKEVLGLFKQGLKDFSVTREKVEWGLDFSIVPGQKIYVWVEALQNYISAIGYGRNLENYQKCWPADLHLIGKDIIKFHAIYWPAMLLAAGEKLPKKIYAHGFFSINGQKMSKTLGNVIDPNEMVKKYGVDATRYLLLSQFPFGQDGDIKAEKFDEQYNAFLANGLGNLVSRVAKLIEQSGGKLKDKLKESDQLFKKFSSSLRKLEFTEAIAVFEAEINNLDDELQEERPWEKAVNDKNRLTFLQEASEKILAITKAIEPFLPETSLKIKKKFTAPRITKGKPLFPRIEA